MNQPDLRRRTVLRTAGVAFAGGIGLASGVGSATPPTYIAELVPGIDEAAWGRARFTLLDDEIRFDLVARGLDELERAMLLAGVGDVGTEAEVGLDEAGRLHVGRRSISITGTIRDEDVGGGDPTVAELIENIEGGEDPRVWVFVDSEACGTVPSGACLPGLGLRGGLEPVGST